MGYDLFSQTTGEDFRWSQPFWGRVLELARKNGWQQKGTTIPMDYHRSDWDGNYWYNSGEIVEVEDALSLADALTRALDTLPKEDVSVSKSPVFNETTKKWEVADFSHTPVEHFFSGSSGRKSLEEFIAFCRKGSFEIR